MRSSVIPRQISNGRALWGMHALWVTVLAKWQSANAKDGKEPEPWRGVEFDKFAHVIHLIWNALYSEGLVSFQSAYQSKDGVHGPGPAWPKRDSDRHVPLIKALEHIQMSLSGERGKSAGVSPDVHLFDLQKKTYNSKEQFTIRPGRERTYVPLHLSDTLPPAWQNLDHQSINQLAALIERLTQSEIRALGTHQTREGTIAAIEYNVFIHLFWRIIEETNCIERRHPSQDANPLHSDLPALESVIQEISRKAVENRGPYTSAMEKIVHAAEDGNRVAVTAMRRVFAEPNAIWVREVSEWESVGNTVENLRRYLIALRHKFLPPTDPDDDERKQKQKELLQRADREGREAAGRIAQDSGISLPPIPDAPNAAFAWNDLRKSIVRLFDSRPGKTPYFFENYQFKAREIMAAT